MTRSDFEIALSAYKTNYPEEKPFIAQFLKLLEHPDCFQRTHLPGHLTGSAWILNREKSYVLLVHHAKLNKWLQPGGHADGDENLLQVALREAQEETGLSTFQTHAPIFDLDIHVIPTRKDFPEHLHYDVRFYFEASMTEKTVVSEESFDVQWVELKSLETYNDERSIVRMKEKVLP